MNYDNEYYAERDDRRRTWFWRRRLAWAERNASLLGVALGVGLLGLSIYLSARGDMQRAATFRAVCTQSGGTPVHNTHEWVCLPAPATKVRPLT